MQTIWQIEHVPYVGSSLSSHFPLNELCTRYICNE